MKKTALLWVLLWVLKPGFAQDSKPNLVYVFDPLCSWCYTFGPVLHNLQEKYRDKVNFSVVAGGMVTGKGIKPISYIAEYILEEYTSMEKRSGVVFGEQYLDLVKQGSLILDSEKPSRAVVAFRMIDSSRAVRFSHDLQIAFFGQGQSLNEDSTYRNLAVLYGLPADQLLEKMATDPVSSATSADFSKAEAAGIKGFPTLLFSIEDKVYKVSEGFEAQDKLEKKIDKLLRQHPGK